MSESWVRIPSPPQKNKTGGVAKRPKAIHLPNEKSPFLMDSFLF
jgi:hypothetical protein